MGDGQKHGDELVVDLWGNQIYRAPRKRGRPPFEWTQENSNKISLLCAMGWKREDIAAVVLDPRTGKAVSVKTLERYFSRELEPFAVARARLNARRLMAVAGPALEGDLGALRMFNAMIETNDRALAAERARAAPKQARPEPVGKKEAARQAALQAVSGDDNGGLFTPGRYN